MDKDVKEINNDSASRTHTYVLEPTGEESFRPHRHRVCDA